MCRYALSLASYALGGAGLLQVLTLLLSEWSTRFKAAAWYSRVQKLVRRFVIWICKASCLSYLLHMI